MSGRAAARRIALCGLMGAGKSSVAAVLGAWLDVGVVDLDDEIVRREGRSIPRLFEDGEASFREAETRALHAVLAEDDAGVIALGGGALENADNLAKLEEATTLVHLDAPIEVLASRLGEPERVGRPLVADEEPRRVLERLHARRAAGFARAAARVDAGEGSPEAIASAVLRALHEGAHGAWVDTPRVLSPAASRAGLVTSGRGLAPFPRARRSVVLFDATMPRIQREGALASLALLDDEDPLLLGREGGEAAKTVASLAGAWEELLDARVDRDMPLRVVGGGTLTDLGGFVASTFKRGLPLDLLPTTLLAQLDAAIGGKNGINVVATKNAVGTITLPRQVHMDSLFLPTLADVDLRGGLAEAYKSGWIGDPELVELIEREPRRASSRALPVLEEIAERAARVKLGVVERDLHESGERRHLNLGHTLGHALEALGARHGDPLPHGDAVAIGMVFAARLAEATRVSETPDLAERTRAALDALGLPTTIPASARECREEILGEIARDKKRVAGENLWVLPVAPGRAIVRPVDRATLVAELEDFAR